MSELENRCLSSRCSDKHLVPSRDSHHCILFSLLSTHNIHLLLFLQDQLVQHCTLKCVHNGMGVNTCWFKRSSNVISTWWFVFCLILRFVSCQAIPMQCPLPLRFLNLARSSSHLAVANKFSRKLIGQRIQVISIYGFSIKAFAHVAAAVQAHLSHLCDLWLSI